ncbi:MAG: hypothetical protein JNL01_16080 [Bdellovibrionales bacterium]|nr:hypothetical protein [Bdellovibrionales bacterium]
MKAISSTLKSIAILAGFPIFGWSNFAHADAQKFQSSFSKIRNQLETEFDLAEQLEPPPLPTSLGTSIRQRDCQILLQKSANWYTYDPFSFQFTGGAARIPTCGGPTGKSPNFIEYSYGWIGLDQTYTKIITYREAGFVYDNIRRFYLDDYDRLVAIINYEVQSGKAQVLHSFSYQTEDQKGNQFHREFQPLTVEPVTGIRGPFSSVRVIPRYVLKTPTQSLRNRWSDQSNPSKTRETRMLSQVIQQDWDEVFIPMPQNWFSAFFKYMGTWYSTPNNWSQIFTKSQNGVDLCFIGTVFKNRKPVENYPETQAEFDACSKR